MRRARHAEMKFADSPLLSQTVPAWRARVMLGALMLGFAALLGRAVYLQGVNNEYYQEKGASRYARTLPLSATRGRIADRYGDMLAVSTPVKSIWAIPEDSKLQPAQVRELARLLDLDVRELDRKLATDGDFVFIKRQVSPETADRVMALKLPGIHDQPEFRRYYPSGEVAAHLIG
ncbi:MAG: penicillin-binding protein 2, partial [Rhodocyclaceae bacterium]|nr:penicillin-binding protein 2 [Rhodocyclaceae bacterium]